MHTQTHGPETKRVPAGGRTSVARRLAVVALLVAACTGEPATVTTTTTPGPPSTTASPTTTTATVEIGMEVQGCSAPPVTFSTLCETIELLEEWHVDRPVDYEALAGLVIDAAAGFTTEETEDPPRTFFCAIPDPAFQPLCDLLLRRIRDERLPVGDVMESAVSAMIDLGLDPFTWYVPPELAGGLRSDGVVGGVGVLLDATDAAGSKCAVVATVCPLRVVFVLEDNPGADAGLIPGDVIVTVDGEPVEGKGFVEVATSIGGDETGEVLLGIERDGAPLEIAVMRAPLEYPTAVVELPSAGVGYLRIPDFGYDIPFVVDAAVEALVAASATTIVIDLRDNPGGLVDAAVSVASQFIAEGVVLNFESPDGTASYDVSGGARATGARLIVLVNEGTASAAEVLAGALRAHRDAVIVGRPTYGKNALQIPFELRNGGEFHVAIARWTTPDGYSVGAGGLIPDRLVDFPSDPTTEELTEFAIENS